MARRTSGDGQRFGRNLRAVLRRGTGYSETAVNVARVVDNHRFRDLVIVLVLLVVADGLVSQFLALSGLGLEMNPFLQAIVGSGGFLLLKVAGAFLAALVLLDVHKRQPKVAQGSAAFFVMVYTALLYWNIAVVLIASGKGL